MAQRHSKYKRQPDEAYWTPEWVYTALFAEEEFIAPWDCAPRSGEPDFLKIRDWPSRHLVSNPPYGRQGKIAERFILHALKTGPVGFKAAFLLPMGFDAAKGRVKFFRDCPVFRKKIVLLNRIRWENLDQKENGPSANHAWYIWDWQNPGKPTTGWIYIDWRP